MVRRAAASKLGEFAKAVEEDNLKNELFPIFEDLAKDDQDSVRVLAVEAGIVLVTLLRDDPSKLSQIKPIMKELAADRSWRSRYMVAERIVEVCIWVFNLSLAPACLDSRGFQRQNHAR